MKTDLNIGDKVIIVTNRVIKTASPKLIKNDVVVIKGVMAKGGYLIADLLGNTMGTVRKSDIRQY